jgi:hypothetical protein
MLINPIIEKIYLKGFIMSKNFYTFLVFLILSTNSFASTTYCTQDPALVDDPVTLTNVIVSAKTLHDSTELSYAVLQNSADLLALSQSLINAGSSANTEYVRAMLRLADDIGTMADRILDMADKILVMADDIGDMADRILETQRIQSANVALTQENIRQTQDNLNSILDN